MGSNSAFFYGTLMAPKVLHRVIHGQDWEDEESAARRLHAPVLRTAPAILDGYRRHRVRAADYPAILPCAGASVRGTYVTGLTDADLWRLDIFEGGEYRRDRVRARVLGSRETGEGAGGEGKGEGEEEATDRVEAETYVWCAGADLLEEREWDFAEFQREKMRFWVGAEGSGEYAGRPSIIEVDEAVAELQKDGTGGRGANGHITRALNEEYQKDEVLKNAV